jgi:hypothetical protein
MTSSKEIHADIVRLEAEIAQISSNLDSAIVAFGNELVPAVNAWMQGELARMIEANAEKINSAGMEPLRAMKADLHALVRQLPQICKQAVSDESVWPHRKPYPRYGETDREAFFPAVFREAISHLGTLLDNHGLLSNTGVHASAWKQTGNGAFQYTINPFFDGRNIKSLKEYADFRMEHKRLLKELEGRRKSLPVAQARESWEQV